MILVAGGLVAGPTSAGQEEPWPTTEWQVLCELPEECAPADEMYEITLERASEWLEGLGFRAPAVERDFYPLPEPGVGTALRYVARISDVRNTEGNLGTYFPRTSTLYLRSDYYFAMGEPGDSFADLRQQETAMFTPVHELLHAIQNAYGVPMGDEHAWITEGTADSVQAAWVHIEGESTGTAAVREHDSPLHLPPDPDTDSYGTWYFWSAVGVEIREREGGHLVSFLRDVFSEDLAEHRGLAGVDRALERRGGLYELLPRVFARRYAPSDFGDVVEGSLRLGRDDVRTRTRIGAEVAEVAGRGFRVEASNDTGEPAKIRIGIVDDEPALHLIVDGTRYSDAGHAPRNVYEGALEEPSRSYDVIVANVARRAIDSAASNVTLEVELWDPEASRISVQGPAFPAVQTFTPSLADARAHLFDSQTIFALDTDEEGDPGATSADGSRLYQLHVTLNGGKPGTYTIGDAGVDLWMYLENTTDPEENRGTALRANTGRIHLESISRRPRELHLRFDVGLRRTEADHRAERYRATGIIALSDR